MPLCSYNYHESSFSPLQFSDSSYVHHGLHLTVRTSPSSSSFWKLRPEAHPTRSELPLSCSKSAPTDPQNTPPALTARLNCYRHNQASSVETRTGHICCMTAGDDRRCSLDTGSPLISSLPFRFELAAPLFASTVLAGLPPSQKVHRKN